MKIVLKGTFTILINKARKVNVIQIGMPRTYINNYLEQTDEFSKSWLLKNINIKLNM